MQIFSVFVKERVRCCCGSSFNRVWALGLFPSFLQVCDVCSKCDPRTKGPKVPKDPWLQYDQRLLMGPCLHTTALPTEPTHHQQPGEKNKNQVQPGKGGGL